MNRVFLVGHLGGDPETKFTDSGLQFNRASLAVSDPKKNKQSGEWESKTYWLRLMSWGKTAERLAECRKGDKVLVEGKITTHTWDKDGVTQYATEIMVDRIQKMVKRDQQAATQVPATHRQLADNSAMMASSNAQDDVPNYNEEFDYS